MRHILLLISFFITQEPDFLTYKSVKTSSATNTTLNDVESHLRNNLGYNFDELGRAHEWSHLINGEARTSLKINGGEVLYCLQNRIAVLKDVRGVTIKDMNDIIPNKLKGVSSHYLTTPHFQRKNAINLFNEWTAYTNGATYATETGCFGWEFELQQAHTFNVYCIYVAIADADKNGSVDPILKRYLKWNIERTFSLLKNRPSEKVNEYLKVVVNDERIVDFLKTEFGKSWFDKYYL